MRVGREGGGTGVIDEDAFQTALDTNPADFAVRLIFADWLEDRGDWRAAGYRWMGVHRKWPFWLPHPCRRRASAPR